MKLSFLKNKISSLTPDKLITHENDNHVDLPGPVYFPTKTTFILHHGIHMAIQAVHVLKSLKGNFVIKLLRDSRVKEYRNDMSDVDFENYREIVQFIFKGQSVIISPDDCYIDSSDNNYVDNIVTKDLSIYYTINSLDYLLASPPLISTRYIVINTKLVPTHFGDFSWVIPEYNTLKSELYNILNRSKLPVVILGERNVSVCNEYSLHQIYNMYSEHTENIENAIDESYDDSKDGYKLENFTKTCNYLTNSILNIFIGNGGGIHLYCSFRNTVQFGVFDRLLEHIPIKNIKTRPQTTNTPSIFLKNINEKLNNTNVLI
jgi:hypothetical protein